MLQWALYLQFDTARHVGIVCHFDHFVCSALGPLGGAPLNTMVEINKGETNWMQQIVIYW